MKNEVFRLQKVGFKTGLEFSVSVGLGGKGKEQDSIQHIRKGGFMILPLVTGSIQ